MRRTLPWAALFGGLLMLLALPTTVSAHQITDVQVDCPGGAIVISGQGFGDESGAAVTVTVTGPDGYEQTFVAQATVPWTVTLPLGPSGSYLITWPEPNGGSVPFTVDCAEGSSPPSGPPSETPSQPPTEPTPKPTPRPTPHPTPTASRSPGHATATPGHTLPPTDTTTPLVTVARSDTALGALLFIAVLAIAATVRWTAQRKVRRR